MVVSSKLPYDLGGPTLSLHYAFEPLKVLHPPGEVRDMLLLQNHDLSGYTNAPASIHAVLKRLHESGEIVRVAGAEGKAMYRWKSFEPVVPSEPKSINDMLIEGSRKTDKK